MKYLVLFPGKQTRLPFLFKDFKGTYLVVAEKKRFNFQEYFFSYFFGEND